MSKALIRVLGALVLILSLSPAAAGAQEGKKSDFSDTVTLREIDVGTRRIVVDDGGTRHTVFAEEKTRILDGSRSIGLAELAVGDRVTVDASYESPEKTGRLLADRIVVVRDPEHAP